MTRMILDSRAGARRLTPVLAPVLAFVVTLAAAPPAAADFDETLSVDAPSLEVANLIGKVTVEPASGSEFQIEVHVRGADGTRENIQVERKERAGRVGVVVQYPLETDRKYVYPEMGRGSSSTFQSDWDEDDSHNILDWLVDRDWRKSVTVKGAGSGLEIWADCTIRVPAGKELVVHVGVGDIGARDLRGALTLDTNSGQVTARNLNGDVEISTGSGDIGLSKISGELAASTGSGDVSVSQVDVTRFEIQTGSGDVEADSVTCRVFEASTGSGRIEARRVIADDGDLQTGSGRISAEFLQIGKGPFELSTGSGSIRLRLPENASADVEASTGSGSIDVDVADPVIDVDEHNEVAFRVGSGDAHFTVETGSGSIEIAN